MTDCLFYGGKGGVGKTTCGAATGLALAAAGRDALVVSTDPAHSLADAYGIELGGEPRSIRPGLEAVEVDPAARAERYERIATALAADLRAAGIRLEDAEVERIFAAGTPAGGDELAALDLLVEYVEDGRWDVVVFDTAPTGHTLRLFDLPEVLGLALETTRSLRGQVRRIADSARRMTMGPLSYLGGREDGEDELVALGERMERALAVITDPERTAFRVVTIPERMAVAETERLVDRLEEAEVPVRSVVVNRVLEDPDPACSRCLSRSRDHRDRLAEIEGAFPKLDVLRLPEADGEPSGTEELSAIGERLVG